MVEAAEVIVALLFVALGGLPVWIVLWSRLVSSTEHTWQRVSDEEQAEMEAFYRQSTGGRQRERREGRPLYRRKMLSAYGVAVYRNGIYAQWHVGRKSKYRFAPFKELAAVYPVDLRLRTWWLKRPYEGYQLETNTGLALVVDSIRHDVPRFRAAVEQVIGPRMGGLLHEGEPIHSSLFDGNLGVHSKLRSRREPSKLPQLPEGSPWARAEDQEKGEFLVEETPEEVRVRKRPYRSLAWGMASIGGAAWAATPFLPPVGVFIAGLFGLGMVVMGLYLVVLFRRWTAPAKLYERGVLMMAPRGDQPVFVAFKPLVAVEEKRGVVSGRFHYFRSRSRYTSFQFPAGSPFGDRVAQEARRFLGRDAGTPGRPGRPGPGTDR